MNRRKTLIILSLIIVILNMPVFAQNSLDSLIQNLPETCKSLMKQRGWPSLSIAIVFDQKIIFSQAFGYADIENQIPATTKTIYRAGSITKVFVATMFMQLAEKGKVNLNDPLIKYIPEYTPDYPVNTGPTTLRQLATYTAGLHVDAAQGFWHYFANFLWVVNKGKGEIPWGVSKNELISTLNKVEIEYTPNMYPNYSNFGYQLLGIALEKVVQEPFDDYIKSNILNPLDMNNSDFKLNDEQKSRLAKGYVYLEPNFDRYSAPEWGGELIKYSGGLYTTPEDIARFISFQFRDQVENTQRVLNGDNLRLMRSQQTLMSPQSKDVYGIGWAMYQDQGHEVVGHAGGHWGFFAKAEFIPDLKFGVVIMTNCNYPQGDLGPVKHLTQIIYEKFIPILEKKQSELVFDPKKIDLNKYVGSYSVQGGYANAEVFIKDDTLHFSLIEKPDFNARILPLNLNSFCFASDPGKHEMFNFYTDEMGNISSLKFLEYVFKKK
jgi:serine beta-lactamase-like protein LACTB